MHGAGEGCSVVLGAGRYEAAVGADMWPVSAITRSDPVLLDLTAVARLYERRLSGLENIIEQLKRPETSQNLEPIHHTNRSPDAGA